MAFEPGEMRERAMMLGRADRAYQVAKDAIRATVEPMSGPRPVSDLAVLALGLANDVKRLLYESNPLLYGGGPLCEMFCDHCRAMHDATEEQAR